jgi:sugar phosphate isomerase/epimerase
LPIGYNVEMSSSLLKNYRGRFPFKLATTSYIYPEEIAPNVARLAPSFDEIELVLFESVSQDSIPDDIEIKRLRELSLLHRVGFNVHLPIDISLGDECEKVRTNGISIVKMVIERTLCLNPSTYTLHLDLREKNGQEEMDIENWRRRIVQSLGEIVECGTKSNSISIETLGYPFEWIDDIVKRFGFSICLDIGHILIHEEDVSSYLERYLSNASIIHLHGFQEGIDHLGIDRLPEVSLQLILSHLDDYRGIVSIEVFSMEDLQRSLTVLEEKWRRR